MCAHALDVAAVRIAAPKISVVIVKIFNGKLRLMNAVKNVLRAAANLANVQALLADRLKKSQD